MNKKKAAYRKLANLLGVGKYFNLSQINVDKAIQSYIFRKSSAIPKYCNNSYATTSWYTNKILRDYPDELWQLGAILTAITEKYLVFREPFVTTENDINIIHENDMFIPDEQHKFENIRLPDWMIPWLMNDADESVLSIMNKFIIEVLCQMEYTDLNGFLNEFHSVISTSTSLEIITLMHKNNDGTPINDNRFLL
jgi:hypothetical protein